MRYEVNISTGEMIEINDDTTSHPSITARIISVTRFQALAALHQAGLLDDIEAYMSLPGTDRFTVLAWENAQEFRRDSLMVQSIGELFGMTEAQLDDIFAFAGTITA